MQPRLCAPEIRPPSRRAVPTSLVPLLLVGLLSHCGGTEDPPATDPALDPRGAVIADADRGRDPGAELPEGAQARSLLGEILFPPPLDAELRREREENLSEALREREANPDDPEAWIWVGRHQAYLGEYRDAIDTFTEGWERFPGDARFLRHRGHRHLSVRAFDRAVADLTLGIEEAGDRMAEVEPDGLPNPLGIPLTTLGFNLWYHRALAEYLQGDFARAERSWEETLGVSDNPDLQVAGRYWLHLTRRQRGDDAGASEALAGVGAETEVIENASYRDLILLFQGARTPEDLLGDADAALATVTLLYGIAMHHLLSGDEAEGRARLQEILDRPEQWPAFGYIAAEAEVARRGW